MYVGRETMASIVNVNFGNVGLFADFSICKTYKSKPSKERNIQSDNELHEAKTYESYENDIARERAERKLSMYIQRERERKKNDCTTKQVLASLMHKGGHI